MVYKVNRDFAGLGTNNMDGTPNMKYACNKKK